MRKLRVVNNMFFHEEKLPEISDAFIRNLEGALPKKDIRQARRGVNEELLVAEVLHIYVDRGIGPAFERLREERRADLLGKVVGKVHDLMVVK
jgi:hypothetical protein